MRIKPVLDYIAPEPLEPQTHAFRFRSPHSDMIVDRCKGAFACFKEFTCGTTSSATSHALAVVRSLYPSVELDVIDGGFTRGTTKA